MVQLTLLECGATQDLQVLVASLERHWAERIGGGAYLEETARITVNRLAASGVRASDRSERARIEAYFAAVMRRRLSRSSDPDAQAARRRLVIASIEADLRDAGWDAQRATEEAFRATGAA